MCLWSQSDHKGCKILARTQFPIHFYTLLIDKPYARRVTILEFEVRNPNVNCLTSTILALKSFRAEFPRLKQARARITIPEVDDFSQWGNVDVRAWALQVRDGINNMLTALKRTLASTELHKVLHLQLALTYEITTMYVSSDFVKEAMHFLAEEGSYQLETPCTATKVMLLPNYIPLDVTIYIKPVSLNKIDRISIKLAAASGDQNDESVPAGSDTMHWEKALDDVYSDENLDK